MVVVYPSYPQAWHFRFFLSQPDRLCFEEPHLRHFPCIDFWKFLKLWLLKDLLPGELTLVNFRECFLSKDISILFETLSSVTFCLISLREGSLSLVNSCLILVLLMPQRIRKIMTSSVDRALISASMDSSSSSLNHAETSWPCLLYTSPSPRDRG